MSTPVPTRPLGKNGPLVSKLGFGAMGLSCIIPFPHSFIFYLFLLGMKIRLLVELVVSFAKKFKHRWLMEIVYYLAQLYGQGPSREEGLKVLDRVFELGCRFWDTAGKFWVFVLGGVGGEGNEIFFFLGWFEGWGRSMD